MRLLGIIILLGALSAWGESVDQLFVRAKREQDPARQIKLLSQVVEQSPKHVGAYHYRADAYFALGRYPQAVKDYNRVVSLRPQDPFRYYARGLAYTQMGEHTLALADFTKAISLNPEYDNFYLARARAYRALGKNGPALTDYKKYAGNKWSGASSALLREVIPVSLAADRYDTAVEQLTALQALETDSADMYRWQGQILQAGHQFDEAISSYSKAINRAETDVQAYRLRAAVFKAMGDYSAALEDYTYSLEISPEAEWFNCRGEVYAELGDLEQAVADYTRALALDPSLAVAYANRGYAKLKDKDFTGAKSDLETAIQLSPSVPEPYVYLAGAYWFHKKDRKRMYEYLQQARRYHFKNSDDLFDEAQLGWLFKGVSNTAEFRSLWYK